MPLTLQTKTLSGYIIAFLLLLVSYILIFYTIRELGRETRDVTESYSLINHLESLHSDMAEAETGVRGYIISREVSFLMPYYASQKTIPRRFAELDALARGGRIQKTRIEKLKEYCSTSLAYMENAITRFQKAGLVVTDTMLLNREERRLVLDSMRLLIAEAKKTGEKHIASKTDTLSGFFSSTKTIAITSLLVAILTIIYSLYTYKRENKAREEATNKVIRYQQELETKLKELKKLNAELQDLRQIEKFAVTGRIARTIAHEVRNPLTNITLAAEQLHESLENEGEQALMLEMIGRNASRIDQLVTDLLQSTRFAQLEFKEVDINHLLDETLELAADRIQLQQLQVEKDYSPDLCTVKIDKEKMQLALLNIIVNAIEAMPAQKGVLKLKTMKRNDKCVIEIADNGKGMDEETMQKVFEPYYTGKKNGHGLGLTNSQNIIFNHRGKITVRSKPDWGTVFTISLQLSSLI
jgi:signal transduction histidine kinase